MPKNKPQDKEPYSPANNFSIRNKYWKYSGKFIVQEDSGFETNRFNF